MDVLRLRQAQAAPAQLAVDEDPRLAAVAGLGEAAHRAAAPEGELLEERQVPGGPVEGDPVGGDEAGQEGGEVAVLQAGLEAVVVAAAAEGVLDEQLLQ